MRLLGRVALVTGAGSGIGRAIAVAFAKEGAKVAVLDINGDAARLVANEIPSRTGAVLAIEADVTDEGTVERAVARIVDELGDPDILVNNAGYMARDGLLDHSEDDWDRTLAVCLKGPAWCSKHVLPPMLRNRRGAIVNIASVNGLAFYGAEAYSAAKAGLISLTKAIAVRYGPDGIRANAIAPAAIRTPAWGEIERTDPDAFRRLGQRYPLRRIGRPEDVASAAVFLASDEASWITGVVLPVDGGLLAGDMTLMEVVKGKPVGA